MDAQERPVPLKNVIYMGDGPIDIPCMSIVQRAKGYVIGILSKQEPESHDRERATGRILAGDVLRATYEIKYRHYAFNVKVVGGRVEF